MNSFTLKDGIFCIKQEIAWCKDGNNTPDDMSKDEVRGFISGLEQALFILNQLDKNKVLDSSKTGTSTSHFLYLPK